MSGIGLAREISALRARQTKKTEPFGDEIWSLLLGHAHNLDGDIENCGIVVGSALKEFHERLPQKEGEIVDLSAQMYDTAVMECCLIQTLTFNVAMRMMQARVPVLSASSEAMQWIMDTSLPTEKESSHTSDDDMHASAFCESLTQDILMTTERVWYTLAPAHEVNSRWRRLFFFFSHYHHHHHQSSGSSSIILPQELFGFSKHFRCTSPFQVKRPPPWICV